MTAALKAGATYFVLVYAIGFLLGTVRVLLLLPLVGETAAVLLEAPLMLVVSWIAARWSSRRFTVPATVLPRLMMCAAAFALLILGELAVSRFVFGRSLEDTLATYRSLPGILGLSAQVIFTLLPLAQAFLLPSARNPKRFA
jgi:hypothetical protein